MADSDSDSEITDDIKCFLCSQRFRDPRFLGCFHSFCLPCLQNYVQEQDSKFKVPCPLCHSTVTIPKSGADGLEKNFYSQAVLTCQIFSNKSNCEKCYNQHHAEARCLDCSKNFCCSCSIEHLEVETNDHHIVGLSSPHSKKQINLIHKSFCSKHKTQELKYYCMLCDTSVCKECVSKLSEHKGHKYKTIEDAAKEKRDKFGPILKSMQEYVPCLEEYMEELKTTRLTLEAFMMNTVNDIRNRANELKKEIDRIATSLVLEVKHKFNEGKSRIDNHVDALKPTVMSLSSLTKTADHIINLSNDSEVVRLSQKLHGRFRQIDTELPSGDLNGIERSMFKPGEGFEGRLDVLVGLCEEVDMDIPPIPVPWGLRIALQFEVKLLHTFRCADEPDTIHALAPISEDEAWLCCGWGSKQMALFNSKGEKKASLTMEFQIDDICVLPDGNILVSSYENTFIKKIDKNRQVSHFADLPCYPGGMTVSKKKHIFVCAIDSYVTTRSDQSKRMVIKLSENGEILEQIERNGPMDLFCAPYRISLDLIGDMIISDRDEKDIRVTILAGDNTPKQTYLGPPNMSAKQPFNPLGVCCDRLGHILVSDWTNHTVHLLDLSGQFLGYLLTKRDGILGPNAIALDNVGHLWVGDSKSSVRVFKYSKKATTV